MNTDKLAEKKTASYRRVLLALACGALVRAPLVSGETNYDYPKCPSLAQVGAGPELEQVIQIVAREMAGDSLARQFGRDRQAMTEAGARRLAGARQFETRLDELQKRIQRPQIPAAALSERYVVLDGLLAAGRRRADTLLVKCVVDYWLAECGLSRLDLALWADLEKENPDSSRGSRRFLLSDAERVAAEVVADLRRGPYDRIEQAVKQQRVEIRPEDTPETALQHAVEQVLQTAGVAPSAEFVLLVRGRLRPAVLKAYESRRAEQNKAREAVLNLLRQAAKDDPTNARLQTAQAAFAALEAERHALATAVRIDETVTRLLADPKAGSQRLCDWSGSEQEHLLLAAALIQEAGGSTAGLCDGDLGWSLITSMGLPSFRRSQLGGCFAREAALVGGETEAGFFAQTEPVLAAEAALRESLTPPAAFRLLAGRDASQQWSQRVAAQLRQGLSRSVRGSSATRPSLVEEAANALVGKLDAFWQTVAVEQVRARRVRVALLTIADLGNLEGFHSFTGWPLREKVRNALEDVLRREGWPDECLGNYFVSRALDTRAGQLARVVAQVYEKP